MNDKTKEEGEKCLKSTLEIHPLTADFFIGTRERFGFVGGIKRKLGDMIELRLGKTTKFRIWLQISFLSAASLGLKEIIACYYDHYLDIIVSMGLDHVERTFITSIPKWKLISCLNNKI